MRKLLIISAVLLVVLSGIKLSAQSKFDSLVIKRNLLLTKYTALSPGQKIDTGSLANISEIFIIENLLINEEKKLSDKIKYADSINSVNTEIQNKIKTNAARANKIHRIIFISGGGLVLLFLVFLFLFIFTKIRLNKRIRELKKAKKTHDIILKEKSDYEQSLLKDIENLTNGYKSLEAKNKELEKFTLTGSGNIAGNNKSDYEELLQKVKTAESGFSEISELNKELNLKSNELALKNIELSDKIKDLENELLKAGQNTPVDNFRMDDSKSHESQKLMNDIDINFYKIEKLNKLKESAAISPEEYESLKKTILEKINH
jgi:hypothetical protein